MAKIDCQIGVCPFFSCGMIVVAWSIMLLLRTHTPDSCKGIISRTLWGNSTEFHSFQKHGTGTWISQMFDADWGQNSSSSADNGHDLQKLSHYCLDVSSGFKWRTNEWHYLYVSVYLPLCWKLDGLLMARALFTRTELTTCSLTVTAFLFISVFHFLYIIKFQCPHYVS